MNGQTNIIQQGIHTNNIILHHRQIQKHLLQPSKTRRKRHGTKFRKRIPRHRVSVLIRILVLVDDAGVAGALVADEEDRAAVGVAGVDAVGDEAGEAEGGEGEGVVRGAGGGGVDEEGGGAAVEGARVGAGVEDVRGGREGEVFGWGVGLGGDDEAEVGYPWRSLMFNVDSISLFFPFLKHGIGLS